MIQYLTNFLVFQIFSRIKINQDTLEIGLFIFKNGLTFIFYSITYLMSFISLLIKLLTLIIKKSYFFCTIFFELYRRTKSYDLDKNKKLSNYIYLAFFLYLIINFSQKITKRKPYSKESLDILKGWFIQMWNIHN